MQLACLLHEVVEANKKVEMQEDRRWKAVGVGVERILQNRALPQMTLSAKWPRLRAQAKGQERTQPKKRVGGYGDLSQPRISCRAMLMVILDLANGPGVCVVLIVCKWVWRTSFSS